MTRLNTEQIYRRTQDATNNLADRLANLIGSRNIDSTVQKEIDFFGLQDKISDGEFDPEDLNPVISLLENMNLREIAEKEYLQYNRGQNKFRINIRKIQKDIQKGELSASIVPDFNSDGQIDVKDFQALDYVINFQPDRSISLEDQLEGLNDPYFLIRKELEEAGKRRGLSVDNDRYENFLEKFSYFYRSPDDNASQEGPGLGLERKKLTRMIEIFDIMEKENANFDLEKLDFYALKLQDESLPSQYLKPLAVYEAESGFTDQHREGMSELVTRINYARENQDGKTLRMIDQMLRSKKIPLVDEEFTMENILNFLEDINDPIKYPNLIIDSWADRSLDDSDTLIRSEFKKLMQKFFYHYHSTFLAEFNPEDPTAFSKANQKALTNLGKVRDLYVNNYKKYKADLKKIDRNLYSNTSQKDSDLKNAKQRFKYGIDKLDYYAYNVMVNLRSAANPEGFNIRNVQLIYNYDNYTDFDLTGSDREEKLDEYLAILEDNSQENKSKQEFLNYILKSRKIPFAPEGTPIAPANIDNFLNTVENEEAFFKFRVRDMAYKSNLDTYPNNSDNILENFIDKFMKYKFEDDLTNGQITHAKYLFDTLKSKSPEGFELNELDFYVDALATEKVGLRTLIQFINKLHFLSQEDKEHYMEILTSDENTEEKETILRYLQYA